MPGGLLPDHLLRHLVEDLREGGQGQCSPGCRSEPLPPAPARVGPQGTTFGLPASYRALAGSVETVPVSGSTHGHGLLPKNAGLVVR